MRLDRRARRSAIAATAARRAA
eukprot:SAG31_NODE_4199_length_3480_cov_4.559302_1_plen_21_part_10